MASPAVRRANAWLRPGSGIHLLRMVIDCGLLLVEYAQHLAQAMHFAAGFQQPHAIAVGQLRARGAGNGNGAAVAIEQRQGDADAEAGGEYGAGVFGAVDANLHGRELSEYCSSYRTFLRRIACLERQQVRAAFGQLSQRAIRLRLIRMPVPACADQMQRHIGRQAQQLIQLVPCIAQLPLGIDELSARARRCIQTGIGRRVIQISAIKSLLNALLQRFDRVQLPPQAARQSLLVADSIKQQSCLGDGLPFGPKQIKPDLALTGARSRYPCRACQQCSQVISETQPERVAEVLAAAGRHVAAQGKLRVRQEAGCKGLRAADAELVAHDLQVRAVGHGQHGHFGAIHPVGGIKSVLRQGHGRHLRRGHACGRADVRSMPILQRGLVVGGACRQAQQHACGDHRAGCGRGWHAVARVLDVAPMQRRIGGLDFAYCYHRVLPSAPCSTEGH